MMRSRGGRGGFTLVEIMVVIAILGAVAAVSVPAFREAARPDPLRDATASVTRVLERARITARTNGHRVTLTVDPMSNRFWVDEPSIAGTLELPRDAKLWSDRPRARFTFAPAGPASADLLAVQANGRSNPILVDRFTGEVSTNAR